MKSIIGVMVLIVVAVAVYFLFFASKPQDVSASPSTTPQVGDNFGNATKQSDLNIRDIPAQIGLSQLSGTTAQSAQDAVRSLFSNDFISEDALRALNDKLHSVGQVNVGNPVTDGTGGQVVKTVTPEDVKAALGNATVTNPLPPIVPQGNMSINKQVSMVAQQYGTAVKPAGSVTGAGQTVYNVGALAKTLGRPVITTSSGKQVVVIGGRTFETRLALTQQTLDKLLASEKK